jgi:pimeloyl-ACP methyl ester carboxylesterase
MAPEEITGDVPARAPAPEPDGSAGPEGGPAATGAGPAADPDEGASRAAALAAAGYNPVALPTAAVPFDLITDSWAELALPAIAARSADLAGRSACQEGTGDLPPVPWLDFDCVVPTTSGRTAEALLCRSWPRPPGRVLHNSLFPTWLMSLADGGFRPELLPGRRPLRGDEVFRDLDLDALRTVLGNSALGNSALGDSVPADSAALPSLACLELSDNAGGGYPLSLGNLRAAKRILAAAGVPLVLDATRVVENAIFVIQKEPGQQGRRLWPVVADLLATADAVTMSLSKDFGLDFGGLVATSDPALASRLRAHVSAHGHQVNLAGRKLIGAALTDEEGVAALAGQRKSAVHALWSRLNRAGVPVVSPPAGHCVLIDTAGGNRLAGVVNPVPSCLAWLYARAGVRGGPHLAAAPDGTWSLIRLAVPLGLDLAAAREAGGRIASAWRAQGHGPAGLVPSDPPASPAQASYQPAAQVPEDIQVALRAGVRATNDNAGVLAELAPGAQRHLVRLPDGDAEVFTAGTGPALLLIHPFNIGAGVFGWQFAGLADRYQVIVMHAPGVGATTATADLTLSGLARTHREALRTLGVTGPVHVAGASFGGLTAQQLALSYPDEVASLTLICSSFKCANRVGEVNRLSVVLAEDLDRIAAETADAPSLAERERLERLLLRCESMDPQTGLRYLDVFAAEPTLLSRLPDIGVPTLVVQGPHDTVIPPKTAHLLHGAIPGAEYTEIGGAGHFPALTHPSQLNDILAGFLARHDRGRAQAGDATTPTRGPA